MNGVQMTNLSDLDILLSVIENPTRRRILEALVREPHYPLQLSRELGLSQQAIMKHLKVLEDYSLVRSYPEESDQGGPTRKIYVPTTKFTIIVDFGPGLFDTTFVKLAMEAMKGPRGPQRMPQKADLRHIGKKVAELRSSVAEIDAQLKELQRQRESLIAKKEEILEEAASTIEGSIDDYQVRKVIYEYVQNPDMSPRQIAEELGLRDDFVEHTIRGLQERSTGDGGGSNDGKGGEQLREVR
ncbi:MAG: helix-turn-helix domain-containing protein [Methanomassiliicoccales archaeon]